MDKITVSNDDLTRLLECAPVTCSTAKEDTATRCIHLSTARIPNPEGPGEITALVATTTDQIVAGQFTVPCEGTLSEPILLPLQDNRWIVSSIKNVKKLMREEQGKNAECAVILKPVSTAGSGAPDRLVITSTTNGFAGSSNELHNEIGLYTGGDFPLGEAMRYLSPAPEKEAKSSDDNKPLSSGQVIGLDGTSAKTLADIAAKSKLTPLIYAVGHSCGRRLVTAGDNWLCSIPGYLHTTVEDEGPGVELVNVSPSDTDDMSYFDPRTDSPAESE